MTWRQLLRKHASGFLEWLESSGKRFECFHHLADALETFLLNYVLADGLEAPAVNTKFAQALPLAFSNSDEPIYDEPFVAEEYAFVPWIFFHKTDHPWLHDLILRRAHLVAGRSPCPLLAVS